MNVLWVKVTAPVASFRRPLDHNYQRTLLLPPYTTLIGLAGAALGLSDREMWQKGSVLRELCCSVLLSEKPGKARDMWSVMKLKNNKISGRSPYMRELLFFARYVLLYGGPSYLLQQLKDAFMDPTYPLSLGREDELIVLEDMGLEEALTGRACFSGTILPGDIRKLDFRWEPRPGIRFEIPVVEVLPLGFEVDRKGVRHPVGIRPFTFLPLDLEVEVPEQEEVFTLEVLQGRNFTWMNSLSSQNQTCLF